MKQPLFEGRWTQVKHRVSGVLSANPWTRIHRERQPQAQPLFASPPSYDPPQGGTVVAGNKETGVAALSAWEEEGGTTAKPGAAKKLV